MEAEIEMKELSLLGEKPKTETNETGGNLLCC